jgi:DNA-binding response OmpR family regulator
VLRVLVADVDLLLCEIVRFNLEAIGHDVAIVNDGASALEAARSSQPDVIVLDSMMPVMSGPEVLRALKEHPQTEHIPVVMLTARRGQDDVVDALRAGAGDYLTKPFMPEELLLRIDSLAARNGRRLGDATRS